MQKSTTGHKIQLWKVWESKAVRNGPRSSIHWIQKNKEYREKTIKGESASFYLHGNSYRGYWKNDKKHGYGIQIWKNGVKYEGEWSEGMRDGRGTLWEYKANKHIKKYLGNWKNDKKHGPGVYYYSNSSYYEGNWKNNYRDGRGRMVYENGDIYDGNWVDDKRSGAGVLVYINGDRYEGYWYDDLKQGPGKFYYHTTGKIYEGEWLKDIAKCGFLLDGPRADESGLISLEAPIPEQQFEIPILRLINPNQVVQETIDEIRRDLTEIKESKHTGQTELTPDEVEYIHKSFTKYDYDRNGHIYAGSLVFVLEDLGVSVNYEQLQDILVFLHKDEESPIEFKEFCYLMSQLKI